MASDVLNGHAGDLLAAKDLTIAEQASLLAESAQRIAALEAALAKAGVAVPPVAPPRPTVPSNGSTVANAEQRRADLTAATVLVVANDYPGQPAGVALPQVGAEAAEYCQIVKRAGGEVEVLRNVTVEHFRASLGKLHPDVLVFCGHGDADLGQGLALAFMNSERGRIELERDETIADILCAHASETEVDADASGGCQTGARLQLLVLNGCCTLRLANLMRVRAPPALRHIVCWRTITHDEAARAFGISFLRRRLRRRHQQRRESPRAAFEGAKCDVLLHRADSTLGGGWVDTSVPKFAFADPNDGSVVDQGTRLLLDGSSATAAGVPAFVDLHVEAKIEEEKRFADSVVPLLREWLDATPSSAPQVQALREELSMLEISAAEGDAAAREKCAELVAPTVESIRATAAPLAGLEQVERLRRIVEEGNKIYLGIHSGVLGMVRSNDGYEALCAELDAVGTDETRYPQQTGLLVDIYDAASQALPLFGQVCASVVMRAGAAGIKAKMRVVPLKHMFRVIQKHAMRADGESPTECETACDIVRGSITCGSTGELLGVLRLLLTLQAEGTIQLVRIKNRFKNPTAAGWADVMLNLVCLGGGDAISGHVCELQLLHATMLKARKDLGGHNAYASFREAAEILEFIVGDVLAASAREALRTLELTTVAEGDATGHAAAAGTAVSTLAKASHAVPKSSGAAGTVKSVLRVAMQLCKVSRAKWREAQWRAGRDMDIANDMLLRACSEGDIGEAVIQLLAGADITTTDGARGEQGFPSLELACLNGHAELIPLLVAAGADIDEDISQEGRCGFDGHMRLPTEARRGDTYLHFASRSGNVSVVKALIAAGADLNMGDKNGLPALLHAVYKKDTEIAQAILTAGANPFVPLPDPDRDNFGLVPDTPILSIAAFTGDTEMTQMFLSRGCEVNAVAASNAGAFALYFAAQHGRAEVVQLLIASGADVNMSTGHVELVSGAEAGCTALHQACCRGYVDVVIALVAAGADVNAACTLEGTQGHTPLLCSCRQYHDRIPQLLLAAGAQVNAELETGETAMALASKGGHLQLMQLLVDSGARASPEDMHQLQGLREPPATVAKRHTYSVWVVPVSSSNGVWICGECTLHNNHSSPVCEVCKQGCRPEPVRGLQTGTSNVPPSDDSTDAGALGRLDSTGFDRGEAGAALAAHVGDGQAGSC